MNTEEAFDILEKGGKRVGLVTVHKQGKTFTRKQLLGKKEEEKKPKNKWIEKYSKLGINKFPPIDFPEDKVTVNLSGDVNSHAVLSWRDEKAGRTMYSYTKEFLNRNAIVKWERIKNINSSDIENVKSKSLKRLSNSDKTLADASCIIHIISQTGLRVGDKKLFQYSGNRGVSTLSPENVTINGSKVSFNFTGKSYQENNAQINNKKLADYLTKLKEERKGEEFLFNVDKKKLSTFFKEDMGMKGYKIKDIRTFVATDLARKILFEDKNPPPPLGNTKEQKKMIREKLKNVFEKVSHKLNNTPLMAKQSYIHPIVLNSWAESIGLSPEVLNKAIREDELELKTLDDIISENKGIYEENSYELNEFDEEECDEYLTPEWLEEETELNNQNKNTMKKAINVDEAFDILEKGGTAGKHWHLESGKRVYDYDKMSVEEHKEAIGFHRQEEAKIKGTSALSAKERMQHRAEYTNQESLAKEKSEKEPKDVVHKNDGTKLYGKEAKDWIDKRLQKSGEDNDFQKSLDFLNIIEKASPQQQEKVHKVMTEFKEGKLKSGSKNGEKVTDRARAMAISLSEAGLSKGEDIEKGGEGSKGGKVIGHTKSGKPIYETTKSDFHGNYSRQDHIDAAEKHKELLKKEVKENPGIVGGTKKWRHHVGQKDFHEGEAELFYEHNKE